jgi:cytochrome c oxidase subunit 2
LLRKAYVGLIAMVLGVTWMALGCQPGPKSGAGQGAALYDTCQPCHGRSGEGNPHLKVPPIAGLPEWYLTAQLEKFKTDVRGAHPDDMDGHRMRPMARTLRHPGDVAAIAKYVAALPARPQPGTLTVGDRTAGEAAFAVCTACHGMQGEGNQDLSAPPLRGQADWYMVSQLHKFKNGMRGAHPDDVTGTQMAAMASTLADSAAVYDVVAYIRTLAR